MTLHHPIVTLRGERIIYHNIAVTYQHALITGWCIMALNEIHWLYAREVWRDVFRGSFERIGQPQMARAMDFKNNCQVLEFRRG